MDYNIYIHDKTSGQKKATQPRSGGSSNTTPNQTADEMSQGKQDAAEGGMVAAAKVSTAGKVLLAVYAAAKITKSIVDTVVPFVARETGDYRFSVAWHNSWQTLNNFLNPISHALTQVNYYQETMLVNKRQEQQRLLVGDSYINGMSRTY